MTELDAIGGDIRAAIDRVSVPSYVLDQHGIIRWVNPAAKRLVGDVRGRHFTSVVAPEDTRRARERFARTIVGSRVPNGGEIVLVGAGGERVNVDISAVRLTDDHRLVGVFGQVSDVAEENEHPLPHHLTPRQTVSESRVRDQECVGGMRIAGAGPARAVSLSCLLPVT